MSAPKAVSKELYSLLGKLARKSAFAKLQRKGVPAGGCCEIYSPSNDFKAPIARFDRSLVDSAIDQGYVEAGSRSGTWQLAVAGANIIRAVRSAGEGGIASEASPASEASTASEGSRAGDSPAVSQVAIADQAARPALRKAGSKQAAQTKDIAAQSERIEAIDLAESPLGWLRRRKGRNGQPLIDEAQFLAGERLRAEFWRAQITPKVTADWSMMAPTSGKCRAAPGDALFESEKALAAQARVRRTLDAVGPELSGVLIDVCCHLKGLEITEKEAGWPQRSGKVVLMLALSALARHYGFSSSGDEYSTADGKIRHWGHADYKPSLDGS